MGNMQAPIRKRIATTAIAALTLGGLGCAVRDDPRYNPYANPRDGPIGPRAQKLVDDAQAALDRLDHRAENALY